MLNVCVRASPRAEMGGGAYQIESLFYFQSLVCWLLAWLLAVEIWLMKQLFSCHFEFNMHRCDVFFPSSPALSSLHFFLSRFSRSFSLGDWIRISVYFRFQTELTELLQIFSTQKIGAINSKSSFLFLDSVNFHIHFTQCILQSQHSRFVWLGLVLLALILLTKPINAGCVCAPHCLTSYEVFLLFSFYAISDFDQRIYLNVQMQF